jgi:hypothetical protein
VAKPGLIASYEAILRAELPLPLAEEVSDGLAEAYDKYQRLGLVADDAAQAAVAEFGSAQAVVQAFSRASPARRIARTLLVTGPLVGMCWALVLITGKAWEWPDPVLARWLGGSLLVASIFVLVTATLAHRCRTVRRAGAAGCLGLAVLDMSMITAVVATGLGLRWLTVMAIVASATRLMYMARAIPPMLA